MVESQNNSKKMMWTTLAMMAFSTVWGFGNVVNGYVYFDGTKVVFSWIVMFLLYFVPYALMVGELGATFKNAVWQWNLTNNHTKDCSNNHTDKNRARYI